MISTSSRPAEPIATGFGWRVVVCLAIVIAAGCPLAPARAQVDPARFQDSPADTVYFVASEVHRSAELERDAEAAMTIWKSAVGFWELFLEKAPDDPRSPTARFRRAVGLQKVGGAEASDLLREVLDGDVSGLSEEDQLELALILPPVESDPTTAEARVRLLDSLIQGNDVARFERDFDPHDARVASTAMAESSPAFEKGAAARFLRGAALDSLNQTAEAAANYDLFRSVYKVHPFAPEAVYRLGFGYAQREDHSAAEDTFREFLADWPGHDQADAARLGLANALYAQARYEAAGLLYRTCSESEGFEQAAAALLGHARCLAHQQDYDAAASRAETLLDDPTLGPEARSLASRWWLQAEQPDRAEEVLRRESGDLSRLTEPERQILYRARMTRAERLFRVERWPEAASLFETVAPWLDAPELRESAWHHAGLAHFRQDNFEGAMEAFDHQIEDAPRGALAAPGLLVRGFAAARRDSWQEAIDCFDRAVEVARGRGDLAFISPAIMRAGALFEHADRDGPAGELYQKLLDEPGIDETEHVGAHEGLARLARRRGDHGSAAGHLKTVLRLGNHGGEDADRLRVMVGQCLRRGGELEAAEAWFAAETGRIESDRWLGLALFEQARCRERLGHSEEALDVWYDLANRLPEHPRAAEAEGRLREDLERRFGASGRSNESTMIDPNDTIKGDSQ